MKSNPKLVECLFGHHDYSKKLTVDSRGFSTHLCKVCKKNGYYKWDSGNEVWYDYDENGNCTHEKGYDNFEIWRSYDKDGNCIHRRWLSGAEAWFDKHGRVTRWANHPVYKT